MELVKKNTWVEVADIVLSPDNRSNQLPDDTKKVPYEMKVRGVLTEDASLNEVVTVKTAGGRLIKGKLVEVNPGYTHSFGPPVAELLQVGDKEKQLLDQNRN